jgi:hypothetical protein
MMLKTRPEVVWGESTEIESRKSKRRPTGAKGMGEENLYTVYTIKEKCGRASGRSGANR